MKKITPLLMSFFMTFAATALYAQITSYPYNEDFEAGAGGWTTSGTLWELGTPSSGIVGASSGVNAWATNLDGNYFSSANESLISPLFDFSGFATDPTIRMDIIWDTENGLDHNIFQSSIDGGTTWQNVGAVGDPNNWFNLASGWTGDGLGAYAEAEHVLDGLAGENNVQFRFLFTSDGSVTDHGFAVDDIFIGLVPACEAATRLYVNTNATGLNNGTSWTDAFTDLQPALDCADAGEEIWVAAGTYLPTEEPDGAPTGAGNERFRAFHMANKDLQLYGGFTGTETMLSERDWQANPTILSGDFNDDDVVTGGGATLSFANNEENAHNVFVTVLLTTGAEIDGFSIEGGNADNTITYDYEGRTISSGDGGGMFNSLSSPTLSNVTFTGNNASIGGGMNNQVSSPTLTNVTFSGNNAPLGGGISNEFSSSPTLTNVTFSGNNGTLGGGMYNGSSSSPTLTNTIFYGNTSVEQKDIYNEASTSSLSFSAVEDYDITGCATCITLTADPFVNAADPDGLDNILMTVDDGLRLVAGSPPAGVGTATGTPTTDITGAMRPNPPSMGAYEAEPAMANIVVTGAGDLEFTDNDDRDDNLTIVINGANYRLTDPSNPLTAGAGATQIDANTVDIPIASVTGDITINTIGGDDTLTLDFSGGNFTDNINYDGGNQNSTNPGDILTLQGGGTFATVAHLLETESDGAVGITGNSFINYAGLEPVIDNLNVVDREFIFTGAAETITLQNDTTPGFNNIDSTMAESVTFTNPTTSLTINTESFNIPGIDTVNIQGLDTAFDADLTVNGGADDDVRFQTNPTAIGTGDFNINARTIDGNQGATTTGAGSITFNAVQNIQLGLNSPISAENGDITFNANTTGTTTGVNTMGISISNNAVTTSGSGNIIFNGIGTSTGVSTDNYGVEVFGGATVQASGNGSITFTGTGGDGDFANYGVVIQPGAIVRTTGGGMQFNGTGGVGTGSDNAGVYIALTSTVEDLSGGAITVNGTGSGTGTDRNFGVIMDGGLTTTTGNIALTGQGSLTSTGINNDGIWLGGNGVNIVTQDGTISLSGTSGTGTNENDGIQINGGAVVQATGIGSIVLDGTSTSGTDNNNGVFIDGAGTSINAVGGNIDITGQGAISGTGLNNRGVLLSGGATINNTITGIINITGTGGAGTFSAKGVEILDVDSAVTVVDGGIGIIGTSGAASEGNNAGISIRTGAQLEATGVGFISMNGTSTQSTDFGDGINVIGQTTAINANGGAITLSGQAAQVTTGQLNYGVEIANSVVIENTGLGTINIMGTGGDGTNDNNGLQIFNSTLRTNNGSLSLTGNSGVGTADLNRGIALISSTVQATGIGVVALDGTSVGSLDSGIGLFSTASTIQTTGGGITINGQGANISTGTNNNGISLETNSAVIDNNGGVININGTSGSGPGNNTGLSLSSAIITTTSGDLSVTGSTTSTGTSSFGIFALTTSTINAITANINVIGSTANAVNNAITIFDVGTTIIAGGTTTLTANTGTINTPAGIPPTSQIQGSIVTFNGAIEPGDIFSNGNAQLPISGNTNLSTGDELIIDINGETTPGTDYDQLAVTGTVDITDATLTLVDNIAIPITSGAQFTIIENDGADAILGNFNGLAEGAIIPFNGQTLRLSYVGGDGNDVVLEEVVVGTLSIVATTQAEEDATNGLFTVTSSTPFTTATNVSFTVGGTATEGTDYTAIGSSFIFPANTISASITVAIIPDNIDEADETVIVTLTGTDNPDVSIGTPDSATVTISDNDETPMITQGQVFTIDENLPNTTAIGTILAIDTDPGTTFGNWTIISGNTSIDGDMDGPFAIDAATGLLTVNDSGDLNFESGTTSFTLSITVSDGTNTSAPETVIININDVNECDPLVPVTNPITVSLIGASYTLTQADRDAITSGSTGTDLNFLFSQETFTCGDIPSVVITVTFTDDCGTSTNEMVTITVEDAMAPTAVCQNITVQLDAFGQAIITADQLDGGSTDNCGNVNFAISQDTFTCADLEGADATASPLIITGVYDGPLTGGTPKGLELKVQQDIADLSLYGIGSANNGGGTDGEEFTFPAGTATAGDYIYLATEAVQFNNFFGFAPDYTDGSMAINGDDAVELFFNGAVIDTFGDINTDGTGEAWDFLDGWAYRMNEQMTNGGAFNAANWSYSGINALDGETTNATAATPFPIGTYFVTPSTAGPVSVILTVTDDAGNSSMCTAEVTVEDNLAPSITCPGMQTETADVNCEFIIPDYTLQTVTNDNCGVVSITQTPAAGSVLNTGITAVEISVSDGTNTNSCTFNLEVVNGITPTITCPMNITENISANCEFILPDYTLLATINNDCSGTSMVTQSPPMGTPVLAGMTEVTLTLDDGTNTSACMFTVTVLDNVLPLAACQDITVELDENGEVTITAADVDGGSSDNCGNVTLAISQDTFTCADLDGSNNAPAPLLITGIYDGSLPGGIPKGVELKVQQDIADLSIYGLGSANNGGGTDGEEFTFPAGTATEGDYIYVSSEIDGFTDFFGFPPTFTDSALEINGDDAVELFQNGNVIDTFGDINVDGNGEAWEYLDGWAYRMDQQVPNNGIFNPTNWVYSGVDALDNETTNATSATPFPIGTFTFTPPAPGTVVVTLTVTDDAGNVATCNATVSIEDNTPPVLNCPVDQFEDLDANCMFTLPDYTLDFVVDDACGTTTATQDPVPGTMIAAGTTVVTISASDGTNNSSCTFNVIAADNTPPVAVCNDFTVVINNTGTASITAAQVDGGSTDNCGNVTVSIDQDTFDCSNVGENMITLTVTDDAGNSSECTATVTVENNNTPIAFCQDITVQLDETGMVTITPEDVDGGSVIICATTESLSIDVDTFDCSNLGPNDVTLTVTDTNGMSSSCTAVVTVEDNIAPIADCNDITINLDVNGMASILPADVIGGSTDNCGIDTVTIDIDTFDCSNLGENMVTLTITDVNGNTSSCTATVTVIEENDPEVVCQDFTVALDAMGMVTISPADVDGGSTDGCGGVILSLNTDTFDCTNLGENNVILTATDISGNSSSCIATVTVIDETAPEAVCQDITIQLDENDMATIEASDLNGASTDACGISEISIDQDTFDCSNLGENMVTLTVTDNNGNTASCIATVTVLQPNALPPVAVCQNLTIPLQADGTATITAATIDAGSLGAGCTNGLSIDMDTFTCDDIGAPIQITLTVTNGNGETDSCTAFVNIVDTLTPVITCPEDIVIIASTDPYELPDFVANGTVLVTDNCIDNLVINQDPPVGTLVGEGETDIEITVTDPSGNEASCDFTIFVDPSLGVENNVLSLNTLSLYPNPASSFVILENPNSIELKSARLIDLTGRTVKMFDLTRTNTERLLDISEIASAGYFLIVEGTEGSVSFQIIKR